MSLQSDLESGDYDRVISEIRDWVAADSSAAFSDHTVKRWVAMRWKDLFLTEAVQDPKALETAGKPAGLARAIPRIGSDNRSDRQKIADRFLKGISAPDWQLELPPADVEIQNTTLLLVPGLLTGLLHPSAHAFLEEAPALEQERGWRTIAVDAHPFRGCEANNADILESLVHGRGFTADRQQEIADPQPPQKVWMLGYSKGGPDVLNFMVNHPEYADRIAGVFTWAGAMSGSYTADSIYEQIKDLDTKAISDQLDRFLQMFNPGLVVKTTGLRRVDEYDIKGAFNDLRTSVREQFNSDHAEEITRLGVPFFSLTGSTTPLEAPAFQFMDTVKMGQFDANNDMQLTQKQATMDIPIATHVAMVHGHHWDIAYSPFPAYLRAASPNLDHPFPRKAALAASWQLLAELGLID